MHRAILASLLALAASACSFNPSPAERVLIVDSPADVRHCTRLGEVSPTTPTVPGFGSALEGMLETTFVMNGTHLYLEKRSNDWLLVRGIAYACGKKVVREPVIRAKG
ncbi:hypothetical protein [Microvirga sp. 2TAF3]|uniref:hypothetical protein n=1 Tax=Microvirga sp. 2TAF3 TaxID=3233014 RepID=UPI003F9BCF75